MLLQSCSRTAEGERTLLVAETETVGLLGRYCDSTETESSHIPRSSSKDERALRIRIRADRERRNLLKELTMEDSRSNLEKTESSNFNGRRRDCGGQDQSREPLQRMRRCLQTQQLEFRLCLQDQWNSVEESSGVAVDSLNSTSTEAARRISGTRETAVRPGG